jgi:hypothetical protein
LTGEVLDEIDKSPPDWKKFLKNHLTFSKNMI